MVIWLSIQLHCLKGERIKRGSGWLILHHNGMEHEPAQEHSVHDGLLQCTPAHYSNIGRAFTDFQRLTYGVPQYETIAAIRNHHCLVFVKVS